jgi:hypothetical protein
MWLGAATGCGSSLSLYQEGVNALNQRQYGEAIELFSEELEENPDSHLALVNRGDAFMQTSQLERAVQDYTVAIQLLDGRDSPNPWFFNRRGVALYNLGRYGEAVADWTRAKELEAERSNTGLKVRHSDIHVQMNERRELMLFDAERQSAVAGEVAVASPSTPAPLVPGPAPEETEAPDAGTVTGDTGPMETAPEETTAEAPTPEETTAAELTPDEAAAEEEARIAAEAAALEAEARRLEEEVERLEAEEARLQEAQGQHAAASQEATPEQETTAEATTPTPRESAPQAARIEPGTDLTGTWVRDDEYMFSLLDDGSRVIGSISATEDFMFYEVTLEWTSATTLTGYAVLKENLSPCKFETSTAWSIEVGEDGTLIASTEEVGWDGSCKETDRTWGGHTFSRAAQ